MRQVTVEYSGKYYNIELSDDENVKSLTQKVTEETLLSSNLFVLKTEDGSVLDEVMMANISKLKIDMRPKGKVSTELVSMVSLDTMTATMAIPKSNTQASLVDEPKSKPNCVSCSKQATFCCVDCSTKLEAVTYCSSCFSSHTEEGVNHVSIQVTFVQHGGKQQAESKKPVPVPNYVAMSNQEPDVIREKYDIVEVLGSGTFGTVKLARCKTGDQQLVAIKYIDRTPGIEGQELSREIRIMKKLRHGNIITFVDVMITRTRILIVMEAYQGGDLQKLLRTRGLCIGEARRFFIQIMEAVQYLHSNNIAHRDLKLENILLTADQKSIAVTDFGLSNSQRSNANGSVSNSCQLHTFCGTPEYLAPEVLLTGWKKKEGYDGFKTDIWACGVILYALLTRKLPFRDPTAVGLAAIIISMKYDETVLPPSTVPLIRTVFNENPKKRPKSNQIIKHPWMKEKDDEDHAIIRRQEEWCGPETSSTFRKSSVSASSTIKHCVVC